MKKYAVLFDVYGTLVDILTDEGMGGLYEALSHILYYDGIYTHHSTLKEIYFSMVKQQKEMSNEKYPEMNSEDIWLTFLKEQKDSNNTRLEIRREDRWAEKMALLFRGLSMLHLELYPHVDSVLNELSKNYKLGIVSDAQNLFVVHELKLLGIFDYFDAMVISNKLGFRKPDPRIFEFCLRELGIAPDRAIFMGNDVYRDIYGAQKVGMKTIFFPTKHGAKEHEGTHPDRVINGYKELPSAVKELFG